MCLRCYRDKYDSASIVTPMTIAAANAIDAVYEWSPSGGDAHIVVDDWNLDDGNIQWCIDNADDEREEARRAAVDGLNILKQLSIPERASAMAIHEGYLNPNATHDGRSTHTVDGIVGHGREGHDDI